MPLFVMSTTNSPLRPILLYAATTPVNAYTAAGQTRTGDIEQFVHLLSGLTSGTTAA